MWICQTCSMLPSCDSHSRLVSRLVSDPDIQIPMIPSRYWSQWILIMMILIMISDRDLLGASSVRIILIKPFYYSFECKYLFSIRSIQFGLEVWMLEEEKQTWWSLINFISSASLFYVLAPELTISPAHVLIRVWSSSLLAAGKGVGINPKGGGEALELGIKLEI